MAEGLSIRVAIVDDHADVRAFVAELLQAAPGIELVASFASGEEAIDRLDDALPDVVLVDVRMGGMSGIACVRRLKQLDPALRILMFTAFESDDEVIQSLEAGADGYLLKPIKTAALIDALRDVHAGGAPMSPAVVRTLVRGFRRRPEPSVAVNGNGLSVREHQVLKMLADGLRYKEIADQLDLSVTTVRTYLNRIYEKLKVTSRTEAVVKYLNRTN